MSTSSSDPSIIKMIYYPDNSHFQIMDDDPEEILDDQKLWTDFYAVDLQYPECCGHSPCNCFQFHDSPRPWLLHYLASKRDNQIAKMQKLIDRGFDVNTLDDGGISVLRYALEAENLAHIEFLGNQNLTPATFVSANSSVICSENPEVRRLLRSMEERFGMECRLPMVPTELLEDPVYQEQEQDCEPWNSYARLDTEYWW